MLNRAFFRSWCVTGIIITDNFCIVLFSGLHKLTVLYNILSMQESSGVGGVSDRSY